jgi:hypothetical protein
LYKFAADGSFLNRISLGSSLAQDLAVDEAGQRLYISALTQGIQIVDISAATPSLIGGFPPPTDNEFYGLHFAADSGHILTTDFGIFSGDPRGLEYSTSGELLAEYRPLITPEVALDIAAFIPPAGDYNGDGFVDQKDYLAWKLNYGQTGNNPADGNGDGLVNAADYIVWRNNLPPPVAALGSVPFFGSAKKGTDPLSQAVSSDVPEPTALAIVLIGWCLCYSVVRDPKSTIDRVPLA